MVNSLEMWYHWIEIGGSIMSHHINLMSTEYKENSGSVLPKCKLGMLVIFSLCLMSYVCEKGAPLSIWLLSWPLF